MNVGTDRHGDTYFKALRPLLARTFPNTTITYDNTKPYDLVVRGHFASSEPTLPYSCPYITTSGESRPVHHLPDRAPLFELNTYHSPNPDSIYFPYLLIEHPTLERPSGQGPKRHCCSYAYSNPVLERELVFRRMRSLEPSCYSFGRCSPTPDTPFAAHINDRGNNATYFSEFAFNVAMENRIFPGYLTEKIGYAFRSGSVPIYWGDNDTVNDFFNPAAFFNVRDYRTPILAAEAAIQIWRDPQKLQSYVDAPLTLTKTLEDYTAIYTEYRPWQKPMVDRLREAFPDFS